MNRTELELFAGEIRLQTIRAMGAFGGGHIGGALSMAELLAVLYGNVMRAGPELADDPARDWLVLSKGHCGPALYAVLALRGYFPLEELATLNQSGTRLPSHCDKNKTPGVDMCTGSLGQGASCAAGVALGMQLRGMTNYTYLILGDGECNEGQVWEMAMFAAHRRLDRLIGFVDWNHQQLDGYTKEICDMGDIGAKFAAFGWYVQQADGHDVTRIEEAVRRAQAWKGVPSMIVLDTVKGKGWSRTEGKTNIHHIDIPPEALRGAEAELGPYLAEKKREAAEG